MAFLARILFNSFFKKSFSIRLYQALPIKLKVLVCLFFRVVTRIAGIWARVITTLVFGNTGKQQPFEGTPNLADGVEGTPYYNVGIYRLSPTF